MSQDVKKARVPIERVGSIVYHLAVVCAICVLFYRDWQRGREIEKLKEVVLNGGGDGDGQTAPLQAKELPLSKTKEKSGSSNSPWDKYKGDLAPQEHRLKVKRAAEASQPCLCPPGKAGRRGVTGDPGEDGKPGPPGFPGEKGENGTKGDTGIQGVPGQAGQPGQPGPVGPQGGRGQPGRKGHSGKKGDKGAIGPSGAVGPSGAIGPPGKCNCSQNLMYVRLNLMSSQTDDLLISPGVINWDFSFSYEFPDFFLTINNSHDVVEIRHSGLYHIGCQIKYYAQRSAPAVLSIYERKKKKVLTETMDSPSQKEANCTEVRDGVCCYKSDKRTISAQYVGYLQKGTQLQTLLEYPSTSNSCKKFIIFRKASESNYEIALLAKTNED
ncbi:uncharacterized protein [Oscarella lobularis]|uniref:uncharacterized protein isoform X2 n=1 Tax=Oscarella lobularis TaxID=121494 RepID=UPI003314367D